MPEPTACPCAGHTCEECGAELPYCVATALCDACLDAPSPPQARPAWPGSAVTLEQLGLTLPGWDTMPRGPAEPPAHLAHALMVEERARDLSAWDRELRGEAPPPRPLDLTAWATTLAARYWAPAKRLRELAQRLVLLALGASFGHTRRELLAEWLANVVRQHAVRRAALVGLLAGAGPRLYLSRGGGP